MATLSGTPGTNLTATVDTSLHGQLTTYQRTADTSPAGFTGTATFTTPGGSVSTQFGGSNNYNANTTKVGQAGVEKGDFAITASTDPALTTSDGGSWELYANVVGLQYTNFGVWSLNPCSNTSNCTPTYAGTIGGAKPGVSLTSTMPTSGSATYTGGAVGYVIQPVANNANNAGQFWGSSSLTANFATGGITGSITGINVYSVNNGGSGQTLLGTMNNIGLTATISGAQYSGTANVTGAAGTAFDISGATGMVKGGFYGPSAAETAGSFYLTGGANNTSLMGSFGAKQAPSDRRLKENVEPAGKLANGLRLYSWRYLGGNRRFTGVMAQDLLADTQFAAAVEIGVDGLMRVDYDRIGYAPADFDAMVAEGEQAEANWRRTLH